MHAGPKGTLPALHKASSAAYEMNTKCSALGEYIQLVVFLNIFCLNSVTVSHM